MAITLSEDVRARLDAHLDAVEKALAEAKCSRERRRGIVDDLEAQILEMLEKRGGLPSVADLEAVLATLDPPAAYAEAAGAAGSSQPSAAACAMPAGGSPFAAIRSPFGSPTPRLSRLAVAGLLCILGSMFFCALALAFFFVGARHLIARSTTPFPPPQYASVVRIESPDATPELSRQNAAQAHAVLQSQLALTEPKGVYFPLVAMACVGVLPSILALIGTLFGWLAFGRIRASKGTQYGRGLALFDGLFYPSLFGLLLFVAFPVPMILLLIVAGGIVGVVVLMRFLPARA